MGPPRAVAAPGAGGADRRRAGGMSSLRESSDKPAKPRRETWRDWMPPDAPEPELLTEADLLAFVNAAGIPVASADLRSWQAAGAIPNGTRRRAGGTTEALYPRWM